MKGRGKSARMAAVAAPRSGSSTASAGAGEDAATEAGPDTTAAFAVDPTRGDVEGEGVTAATAVADAVPAGSPAERDQQPDFVQAAVARAEDLDMDETEYTDEVDNEFVRGRMENVVRVATAHDIKVTFGDGCHTNLSGEVQVDPNDPSRDSSSEDRIVMMQGGLEHEITHELYYDKSAFEAMKSQIEADPSRRPLAFISNILVDGHDEWRHKLARPEAYGIIEAHDELMVRHNGSGRWSFDPDNQDTWTQVTGAMLYRGLPYYRVPEDKLSDEARAAYHDVAPNVDAAIKGTSHDCLAQANEIYDKLKDRGLIPENPEQDHLGGGAGPGAEGSPGMGGSSGSSSGAGSQAGSESGQATEDGELGGDDADAYDASVSGAGGQDEQGGSQGEDVPGEDSPGGGSGGQGEKAGGEQSEGSGAGDGSGGGQAGTQSTSQGTGGGSPGTATDGSSEDSGPGNADADSDTSGAGNPAGPGGRKADGKGSDFVANPGAGEEELESRRRQARSLANTAASKKPQSSQRANSEEQVARPAGALGEFRRRWQKNRRLAHDFAAQIKQAQTETTAPKKRQSSGRLDRGRRRALAAGDEKVFVKRGREREVDMSVELLLDVSGSMGESIDGLKDSTSVISRGLDEAEIEHEVRGFSDPGNKPLYRAFGEKADWKLGSMRAGGMTDMGGGIEKLREGFSDRSEKQKLGLVLADGMPNNEHSVREQLAAARREGVTPFGIFLRAEPDPSNLPRMSNRERQQWIEDRKSQMAEGEVKMRELFGGNIAVLDDAGQLPKVAGKKIVELMRRQS